MTGGSTIPITLVGRAEPLTPAARPEHDDENNWALCDAYLGLKSQIERYARGEIMGQSILLAGHRGSGKTTLVHLAIQQVRWLAEGKVNPPKSTVDVLLDEKKDGPRIEGTSRFAPEPPTKLSLTFGLDQNSEQTLAVEGAGRLLAHSKMVLKRANGEDRAVFTTQKSAKSAPGAQTDPYRPQAITWDSPFSDCPDNDPQLQGWLSGVLQVKTESGAGSSMIDVSIYVDWNGRGAAQIVMPNNLADDAAKITRIEGAIGAFWRRRFAAIPFLVAVHALDLFEKDGKSAPEDEIPEIALSQLRRAAHRALSEELGQLFCGRPGDQQMIEAAAQLRIEMDQTPELAKLRMFWERAKLLPGGLLQDFRRYAGRVVRNARTRLSSQGYKEILALYTSIEAIRGPMENILDRRKPGAKSKRAGGESPGTGHDSGHSIPGLSLSPDSMQDAVRLAAPVLSLLAGAFAAHAVIEVLGPPTTGAIAITTVLLSYSFLRRTIPQRPADTLGGDPSMGSQDLLLPILVERAIEAGLAPVFVVDELDKVKERLEQKMDSLMSRLKYLVSDRAFFCFVADRSYYEQFQAQIQDRSRAYPVQETYFADRFLIYYRPEEIHDYLKKALGKTNPPSAAEPAPERPSATKGGAPTSGTRGSVGAEATHLEDTPHDTPPNNPDIPIRTDETPHAAACDPNSPQPTPPEVEAGPVPQGDGTDKSDPSVGSKALATETNTPVPDAAGSRESDGGSKPGVQGLICDEELLPYLVALHSEAHPGAMARILKQNSSDVRRPQAGADKSGRGEAGYQRNLWAVPAYRLAIML
jgi:hypothetical protein